MQRGANQFLEVRLHILHHNIELLKGVDVRRLKNFNNLYDTWMIKFPQKSNLSEYSFAVYVVLEHIFDTFNCYFTASRALNCSAYTPVASGSQDSLHQIIGANLPVWELWIFLRLCQLLNLFICGFFIEIRSVRIYLLICGERGGMTLVDLGVNFRIRRLLRVRILFHKYMFCNEIFALLYLSLFSLIWIYYLFKCKNILELRNVLIKMKTI